MKKELVIKKCLKCGSLIEIINDCNCEECGIMCCGEKMMEIKPNTIDASFEKHVPTYEIKDNRIYVTVNHVMEEEHYIEWVAMVNEGRECVTYFKPGNEAKTHFKYIPGATIYAYCNKHELWKTEVK